jgi:hypothetical protein
VKDAAKGIVEYEEKNEDNAETLSAQRVRGGGENKSSRKDRKTRRAGPVNSFGAQKARLKDQRYMEE